MKKVLAILLSLLFVLSCVLLVACNTTVTDLKIVDAPKQVTRGDTIDYSKINVVATFDDGTTKTLPLTDSAVSYRAIDTSTTGAKTLTANYGGKSAQTTITVVAGEIDINNVIVTEFNNTDGYNEYLEAIKEQTNKETEFYKRDVGYTVGNVNGYKFVPVVTAIVDGDEVELAETQINTSFKLYRHNGQAYEEVAEDSMETYLSNVENNVYYFTAAAEHEQFKLVVTLDEGYEFIDEELNTTVEQEFTVVNGYNAYDVYGLSVLDNLNNKSWADIKNNTTFDWDNGKKLSEFTNVKQVILHNNITITADNLPANYFWQENEAALPGGSISYSNAYNSTPETLRPYLAGSLKEIYLGEDWENKSDSEQRGLFVSNGIGLNGNFLEITYDDNLSAADAKTGGKGIYVVHDWNQKEGSELRTYPESHWSIICYRNIGNIGNPVVENVYFAGQTGKSNNTDIPAGLMMLSSNLDEVTVNNTIGAYWFSNLTFSNNTTANINDCKLYDSFSQMVYSRHIVAINVTNSEMKRAGGPLFIIITNQYDTQLNIDSTANMESWVTGSEMWFTINMGGSASVVPSLLKVATLSDKSSDAGTHYAQTKRIDGEDYPTANLVAIVIPDAGKVMTNQTAIKGAVNIGESTYGMDDNVFNAILSANEISSQGVTAATNTLAFLAQVQSQLGDAYATYKAQIEALQAGFAGLASLPLAPIYKSGSNYGYSDGANFYTLSVMQQLQAGAAQVQQLLVGYSQTDLAAQWDPIVNNAHLTTIGNASPSTDNWTDGHLAAWINPGADLEDPSKSNPFVKHFMIVLGEGAATAA